MNRLAPIFSGTAVTVAVVVMGAIPFVAHADNLYSTGLTVASSQSWDIVDASQVGLDSSPDMTFSFWVKLASAPSDGSYETFISKWGAVNDASYFLGYHNSGGVYSLYWNSYGDCSSGLGAINVTYTLTTGVWYFISFVKSGGTVTMYVNGSSVGSGSASSAMCNSADPFYIGTFQNTQWYLDGHVDDVRVWARALSSGDVSNLFSNPCTFGNGASTSAMWLFENNGLDSTSNHNDLTGNGGPSFSSDVPYTCSSGGGGVATSTFSESTSTAVLAYDAVVFHSVVIFIIGIIGTVWMWHYFM